MSEHHGVVYTKEWVVELILDIAGYTPESKLWEQRAVEPSCGEGSFLRSMVRRLAESAKRGGAFTQAELEGAIAAYDLDESSVQASRSCVRRELVAQGMEAGEAARLADNWVRCCDYLLTSQSRADYVIGNPPYLRAADIPEEARKRYCERFSSMTRGCDIYVAFIQHGLESLGEEGRLCFICADRWLQNQYGKKLRGYVSERYHISAIVKMHDVDAFEAQVSAYPAIVLLDKRDGDIRYADCHGGFGEKDVPALEKWLESGDEGREGEAFSTGYIATPKDDAFLPLADPEKASTVARLMRDYPTIEETGVSIGIGLATGRDSVFITDEEGIVEEERMLPAFDMRDWRRGRASRKRWFINPWDADGSLIDLEKYPKTKAYFYANAEELRSRHVAKKNADAWYRTIDKVNRSLIGRPMLLFPDMAAKADPVYSDGSKYPCHNCYWLIADSWDLEVLGGLLMSDTAESFVDAMGVKMRGGTLRFQAQYLRLIHVPVMDDIDKETQNELREAFRESDRELASRAAKKAYSS